MMSKILEIVAEAISSRGKWEYVVSQIHLSRKAARRAIEALDIIILPENEGVKVGDVVCISGLKNVVKSYGTVRKDGSETYTGRICVGMGYCDEIGAEFKWSLELENLSIIKRDGKLVIQEKKDGTK